MNLASALKTPFQNNGKTDRLLLAVFLVINLLVLVNNTLHNPEMGYDAEDHLNYMRTLPYRLPTQQDTAEFFSPPLPYFVPSLADKACHAILGDWDSPTSIDDCRKVAGKTAQAINFIFSIGITLLFIQIAETLRPGSRTLKIASLALLGVMTVYYKSFAQARGEPYVAFFTVWAIYLVLRLIQNRDRLIWKDGLFLGLILGLLGLSRQWGFMLFPAVIALVPLAWIADRKLDWRLSKVFATGMVVAFLVSGWFYIYLYLNYGTFTAFNRNTKGFSFSNQPDSFYRTTGLKNLALFKTPTRNTFNNTFIPIFYSEVWGDYWGYFVFIRDKSYLAVNGVGNQAQITPYLGRVNAVSVYPTLIMLGGVLVGAWSLFKLLRSKPEDRTRNLFYAFLFTFLASAFVLYMYFLISYPNLLKGDTIKATYMLHALVILPLLGGELLERIQSYKRLAYSAAMLLLALVFLHNLPAMITRYRMFF